MNSNDLTALIDMGFSKNKVEEALQATGNTGIEAAMEWLLVHPDDSEASSNSSQVKTMEHAENDDKSSASTSEPMLTETVKSIKCDVCNKLFKTQIEVEFHATKSGHDKFSESNEQKKSLTEEEKKRNLQILEMKLKQKRLEKEEQNKKEALEKEKNRIRSGKELSEAKKRLEELEMKKLLDQRKREKEEDRLTRLRIKEQIEADKAARRAKSKNDSENSQNVKSVPPQSTELINDQKTYNETKLQIRLTNGQTITQNFGCKEQLSAVRLYIEMNRTDDSEPFVLMTNFPKKVFTDNDYDTPLDVLGLVPSAVIIVHKKLNGNF